MSLHILRSTFVWLCLISIGFDIAAHGLHPTTIAQPDHQAETASHNTQTHHHTHALHHQHGHTPDQHQDRPHAPTHDQSHHLAIHNRISADLNLPTHFEIPALYAPALAHTHPEQRTPPPFTRRQHSDTDATQRLRTVCLPI